MYEFGSTMYDIGGKSKGAYHPISLNSYIIPLTSKNVNDYKILKPLEEE